MTATTEETMTEMQQVMRLTRQLPRNAIIKNPAGTWSFAGRVDVGLMYARKDGQPLTPDDLDDIRMGWPATSGLTHRTWPTEEAAQAAARAVKS